MKKKSIRAAPNAQLRLEGVIEFKATLSTFFAAIFAIDQKPHTCDSFIFVWILWCLLVVVGLLYYYSRAFRFLSYVCWFFFSSSVHRLLCHLAEVLCVHRFAYRKLCMVIILQLVACFAQRSECTEHTIDEARVRSAWGRLQWISFVVALLGNARYINQNYDKLINWNWNKSISVHLLTNLNVEKYTRTERTNK